MRKVFYLVKPDSDLYRGITQFQQERVDQHNARIAFLKSVGAEGALPNRGDSAFSHVCFKPDVELDKKVWRVDYEGEDGLLYCVPNKRSKVGKEMAERCKLPLFGITEFSDRFFQGFTRFMVGLQIYLPLYHVYGETYCLEIPDIQLDDDCDLGAWEPTDDVTPLKASEYHKIKEDFEDENNSEKS